SGRVICHRHHDRGRRRAHRRRLHRRGHHVRTSSYPWPGGRRAALCVSFDFDGESPHLWRRRSDRPANIGELEQRRYGPRRGVYNILDMLDQLSIRATFFVPGWIAAHYRPAVEAVARAGHELALHGWRHEPPG